MAAEPRHRSARAPLSTLALALAACGSHRAAPAAQATAPAAAPPAVASATLVQPTIAAASAAPALVASTSSGVLLADEPPISLTASDGTGLTLTKLEARAVVEGPLAFTELHLRFQNPLDRRLEGRFAITLPDGAALSRFAMAQGDDWMEAEVVERQAARRAYEDFLHHRQDPALLENEGGNQFSARVFPIEPHGTKDLIVSFSHEARGAYVLPLRGLPAIGEVTAQVDVARPDRSGPAFDRTELHQSAWAPDRDLVVSLTGAPAAVRADDLVAVAIDPLASAAPSRLTALTVMVDTSASRALGFAAQLEDLSSMIADLAREQGGALPLVVAAFDQDVEEVYRGRADGFGADAITRLKARTALGASDVAGALRWVKAKGAGGRLVLVTDAVSTVGDDAAVLAAAAALAPAVDRIDAVLVGGLRDRAAAARLVAALPQDGAVIDGARGPAEVARRIGLATRSGLKVAVDGARWVWPETIDGAQPGDVTVVLASLAPASGAASRSPQVVVTAGEARVAATAVPVPRPLLERAAVGAEIARLDGQRAAATDVAARQALAHRIVELSTSHRVMSSLTGFLVLETEADYQRFGIARTALADILVVGKAGVEVRARHDVTLMAADAPAPGTAKTPESKKKSARSMAAVDDDEDGVADGTKEEADDDEDLEKADKNPADGAEDEADEMNGDDDSGGDLERARALEAREQTETSTGIDRAAEVAQPVERRPEPPAPPPPPPPSPSMPMPMPMPARPAPAAPIADPGPATGAVQTIEVTRGGFASSNQVVAQAQLSESGAGAGSGAADADGADDAEDGPQGGPPPWNGTFAEVMAQLQGGRARDGLAAAWAWRAREPGDVLALVALGEALEATGQPAVAARAYGSVIDLFPGRADLRRFAAERLERVGAAGRALAIDSYRQALASRPDHLTGYRLLAYALVRADDLPGAFGTIEQGLAQHYPDDRYRGGTRVLGEDLGVIGAAWAARAPAKRAEIMARLAKAGVTMATRPSLRFVLYWETDANDVDFHIRDGKGSHAFFRRMQLPSGGELYADITTGYGPECFTIPGTPRAYPYQLQIHYYSRGPMGYGMGVLEIMRHDGKGGLGFEHRPYVIMADGAFVDLGTVTDRTASIGSGPTMAN
ncbi:MAG TPA: VIT domain-containing protein [Kofleriaceae bacterium]|nr:VIT domain-containing protein [Kofleriaceae bacterium]